MIIFMCKSCRARTPIPNGLVLRVVAGSIRKDGSPKPQICTDDSCRGETITLISERVFDEANRQPEIVKQK